MKKIVAVILVLTFVGPAVSADRSSAPILPKARYFGAHVCRGEYDARCSRDFNWPVGTYTHIFCHVNQSDQSIANGICGGGQGKIVYLRKGANGNNCGYDWWDVYC
jgi:hypothetical protein